MFSTVWLVLCLASTPFSFPSLYLAHRLWSKRFLGSIFNQHVALMMIFSGVILPFNLGTAILRVLMESYPEALQGYELSIPTICVSLTYLYITWISPCYYMSICAVLFRFVLVKYSHRGLANDRYYWNMNITLFDRLFWLSNMTCLAINQGNILAPAIIGGPNPVTYLYRTIICEKRKEYEDLLDSQHNTNPGSLRKGHYLIISVSLSIAIICAVSINWKKKRLSIKRRGNCNYNVITMNETLLLICLFSLDSASILHTGLVLYGQSSADQTLTFTLELLRIIIIENLLFKVFVPLYLILQSRTHYKILWAEDPPKKLNFFMTQPSFIPRPIISRYQTDSQPQGPTVNEIARTSQKRHKSVVITIHAAVEDQLPPVC